MLCTTNFIVATCVNITCALKNFRQASFPQIYTTDPKNSFNTLCNGTVSHSARTEGIWVFTGHKRGNKVKQNVSVIFVGMCVTVSCDMWLFMHVYF